jgi:ABC-type multidrug transport system fused ATPase/permease subunit
MQTLKKIIYLLSPSERKRVSLLMIMILITAILDIISVASIMPFMAVLSNPDLVTSNNMLNTLFNASSIFGVENIQQFLFFLGILVFVLLVFSLLFKALTIYAKVRFTEMRQYSIGKLLIEGYLNQPYKWFLNRNSAELGKSILSEVGMVVGRGLTSMIDLIAQIIVTLMIITLLTLVDPKITMIVCITFGGAYTLVYKLTRTYLIRIGKERVKANHLRFNAVSEAFGAAKEVKVGGLEQIYINRFAVPAQTFARHQSSVNVVSQLPRFVLEVIAFGGILLLILYLMAQSGAFNKAIPILALYAFAGYRLMPAIQQIYYSITQLRFVAPALDTLYDDLKSLQPLNRDKSITTLPINKFISMKNISFNYPNISRTALIDINLSIPVRSTVGLVGATGSGKTTTLDIILGLLEAQQGTLEVDGQVINKNNCRAWQRSIGYVPQQIYLADDTVAANIAFGTEPKYIDKNAVERAAKIANIHEFVINELPLQYQTTVGERGVRLSGGQRQRIGIARALYHNPQVLILDEATSALDNLTEQAVMQAINNLHKNITIIIVAHRLSTVKKCDNIFVLDKGKLHFEGVFDELVKNSSLFRKLSKT